MAVDEEDDVDPSAHTRPTQEVPRLARPSVPPPPPEDEPTPAAPVQPLAEADTGPLRMDHDVQLSPRERRLEGEMQMLRQAYNNQSQLLAVMHQMVSRLEQRQAEGEKRLHDRLDDMSNDLGLIKKALNGHIKDGN